MRKYLSVFGRILFAVPLVVFGIRHLTETDLMIGQVPGYVSWGSHLIVILVGLALILAAVSIIVQRPTRLLSFLLGVMILIFALSVHLVNYLNGDVLSLDQMLKDLSLAGAAFYISASLSNKHFFSFSEKLDQVDSDALES